MGSAQGIVEGRREQGRDDHRLGLAAVEPLEVGCRTEAAERGLERGEESLDRDLLGGRRAADDDLAAHRLEASRAHEVWVEACGGLDDWLGVTEPELGAGAEPKNELLSASWLMREESSSAPPPVEVGDVVDAVLPV